MGRLIVCAECGNERRKYLWDLCQRCYSRLQKRRQAAEHHAAMASLPAIPADGAPRADWWRRYHESRRPGLPSRVYRVTVDGSGLVRVGRLEVAS